MQMSARARFLDMLPVLLVFALVAAFATFVLIEYVVREPVAVPPPAQVNLSDMSSPSAARSKPRR